MRIEEQLVEACRVFGAFSYFVPGGVRSWLERCLYQSGSRPGVSGGGGFSYEDWVGYCVGIGFLSFGIFSFLLLFLFSAVGGSPLLAAAGGVGMGWLVFLLLIFEPCGRKNKFAREFEADLSLALLVLSIELGAGSRLREALGRMRKGYGHFSDAVAEALREEKGGAMLQDSLERVSGSVDSVYVRRAFAAMRGIYSKGGGKILEMLADEMLEGNENRLKEYSAKSGLLSQTSTVLTVVFPTLLVCILMVSAILVKPRIPAPLLTALIGFGFTLFAMLLYQYQLNSVPIFVRRLYGISKVRGGLLRKGDVRKIEDDLPIVLEQAAQLSGERGDVVVRTIAELDYGQLSREFEKAHREIVGGSTLQEALEKVYLDTGSYLVKQALDLIRRAYEFGVPMGEALHQTARYIQRIKFVVQESKAATFGERATQIFGFLVSALLFGIVVSMGNGLASLLSGGFMEIDLKTLDAVILGVRINLLVQPFAISFTVANMENKVGKMALYLPLLLLGGNLLFLAASRLSFF